MIEMGRSIIERLFPDPEKKAQAEVELFKLAQANEMAAFEQQVRVAIGQIDVNRAEAASGNWFASSWRPSIGYICAFGLAWNFIIHPALTWLAAAGVMEISGQLPPLVGDNLMELVLGMLGLAGLRSWEKTRRLQL